MVSGIYSNVMKRDYSTSGYKGRYVGMHIGSEFDVHLNYDAQGRLVKGVRVERIAGVIAIWQIAL